MSKPVSNHQRMLRDAWGRVHERAKTDFKILQLKALIFERKKEMYAQESKRWKKANLVDFMKKCKDAGAPVMDSEVNRFGRGMKDEGISTDRD